MNINDSFPSKYLKAADLNGKKVKVKISDVKVEEFDDGDRPVLTFIGKDKGIVLNKTNAMIIASSFGADTDKWTGLEIHLYAAKVQYKGDLVDSIRVEIPQPLTTEKDSDFDPFK